jgi:hypothetical protein
MKKYQVNILNSNDVAIYSWTGEATNAIDALFKAHEEAKIDNELPTTVVGHLNKNKKHKIEIILA